MIKTAKYVNYHKGLLCLFRLPKRTLYCMFSKPWWKKYKSKSALDLCVLDALQFPLWVFHVYMKCNLLQDPQYVCMCVSVSTWRGGGRGRPPEVLVVRGARAQAVGTAQRRLGGEICSVAQVGVRRQVVPAHRHIRVFFWEFISL